MKAYTKYKEWWIRTQGPNLDPSAYWGQTSSQAFECHVKDLGLYRLMEELEDWEETDIL